MKAEMIKADDRYIMQESPALRMLFKEKFYAEIQNGEKHQTLCRTPCSV